MTLSQFYLATLLAFATPVMAGAPQIGLKPTSAFSAPTVAGLTLAASNAAVFNVLDAPYSAKGDGATDDWPAFQKAIEAAAAAGGGTIVVPTPPFASGNYRVGQALRMRSNVTIKVTDPATIINCTGNATYSDISKGLAAGGIAPLMSNYPFFSCIMFGAVEPGSIQNNVTIALKAIAQGDTTLTPTKASSTARFVVGDMIIIETTWSWAGFPGDFQPSWRQLDQVVAINAATGVLTLRHPVEQPVASAQLRRITHSGAQAQAAPGGDAGVPYWATYGAKVLGGTWKYANQFLGSGGALDCVIQPDTLIGTGPKAHAYSTNLLQGCNVSTRNITTTGRIIELAWGSANNTFDIKNATSSANSTGIILWLNEGDHNNSISIQNLTLSGTATGLTANVLSLDHVFSNKLKIGNISGRGVSGSLVELKNSTPYTGALFPLTSSNDIEITQSKIASQSQYITMTGKNVEGNTVENSTFHGLITDKNQISFYISGTGINNTVSNAWGENGLPYCDTTNNALRNVYLPLNMPKKQTCTIDHVTSNSSH